MKLIQKRTLRPLIALSVLLLVGCQPRGETRTLDEVLKTSKVKFESVRSSAGDDLGQTLTELSARLGEFESGNGSPEKIQEILLSLLPKAGYTTRPALTELVAQYRNYGSISKENEAPGRAKLLASRTYTLLASELETTKFKL